jgi:hypothetical protein
MTEQQTMDDFLKGQLDCQDGKPHQPGMSKEYDSGYSAQYGLEQIKAEVQNHAS